MEDLKNPENTIEKPAQEMSESSLELTSESAERLLSSIEAKQASAQTTVESMGGIEKVEETAKSLPLSKQEEIMASIKQTQDKIAASEKRASLDQQGFVNGLENMKQIFVLNPSLKIKEWKLKNLQK